MSEHEVESEYKVFPSLGLVMGFQYKGQLISIQDNTPNQLTTVGITGISDRYKTFKNSVGTGSILVYFTEIGFKLLLKNKFVQGTPKKEVGEDRIFFLLTR